MLLENISTDKVPDKLGEFFVLVVSLREAELWYCYFRMCSA